MEKEIKVYQGGVAVDDRGMLSFCNDFNFENVKRFYMVENFERNFVRAWHGHKKEGKYVTVLSGSALIALVDFRNIKKWDKIANMYSVALGCTTEEDIAEKYNILSKHPKDTNIDFTLEDLYNVVKAPKTKFVCSSRKPSVIWIPPGFVNGAMNLEDNTRIVYFSTKGLGESEGDDYRYEWNMVDYDTWEIEYR